MASTSFRMRVVAGATGALFFALSSIVTAGIASAVPSPHPTGGGGGISVTGGSTGGSIGNTGTGTGGPSTPGGGGGGGGGGGSAGSGVSYPKTYVDSGVDYDYSYQVGSSQPANLRGAPAGPVKACLGKCQYANGAYFATSPSYYYNDKCQVQWAGPNYPFVGVAWKETGVYINKGAGPGSTPGGGEIYNMYRFAKSGTYSCIAGPTYVDKPVMCSAAVGGVGWGAGGSPTSTPSNYYSKGPVASAFVNGGEKSATECAASFYQTFNMKLNKGYGRYKLTATGYQTACTERIYVTKDPRTGTYPPTKILSCFGRYPETVNTVKVELFCENPGWENGWGGNHTFTGSDCVGTKQPRWSCGPQILKKPTFAGFVANPKAVQVLDDGKPRPAKWVPPVPTGVKKIHSKTSQLEFVGGSPLRPNTNPTSSTQPFVTSPSINNWLPGWNVTSGKSVWTLLFQAPGSPGNNWQAEPLWQFAGTFPMTEVIITGVNWQTGAVTTKTVKTTTASTAVCPGLPVNVAVAAARNSSN